MENYVQRMIDEHKQLVERMKKLMKMIDSDSILEQVSKRQYRMMVEQFVGMMYYELALHARLIDEGIDPLCKYEKMSDAQRALLGAFDKINYPNIKD